jgi:hypothetical protein
MSKKVILYITVWVEAPSLLLLPPLANLSSILLQLHYIQTLHPELSLVCYV